MRWSCRGLLSHRRAMKSVVCALPTFSIFRPFAITDPSVPSSMITSRSDLPLRKYPTHFTPTLRLREAKAPASVLALLLPSKGYDYKFEHQPKYRRIRLRYPDSPTSTVFSQLHIVRRHVRQIEQWFLWSSQDIGCPCLGALTVLTQAVIEVIKPMSVNVQKIRGHALDNYSCHGSTV